MDNFKDKKIGILGLGQENLALLKYLIKKGCQNITICDEKSREELASAIDRIGKIDDIQFELGDGYLDNLKNFDIIFRSPGLPYFNKKIQEAKNAGVEVSSQTKLFFRLSPSPIIGVTGTKGKGTTTALIGEILRRKFQISNSKYQINSKLQNPKIFVGGNIGNAPIEFIDKLTKEDIVVLELSSFQLQDLDKSPHVAVVLDVKVDHLDVHKDETEYIQAKLNIVLHQTKDDFAVINADYLTSIEFALSTLAKTYWFSRKKSVDLGSYIINDQIILRDENGEHQIVKKADIQLRGEHNLENICAAVTAAYIAGADIEAIKNASKDFRGLDHRLEFVKEIDSVKYYNDSFSTTPDTTIAGIKSFTEPIILLLGGSEKNADYDELARVISDSPVKMIVSIGKTSERIIKKITNSKINIQKNIVSMTEAIKIARQNSKAGDVILLSPASASFDYYKNYKDRGDQFKKEVLL